MSDYQVLFVDQATNTIQAEVSIFTLLDFTLKYNDVGRFSFEMPYDQAAEVVTYATKLQVYRDGLLVFSGRVKNYKREYSDKTDRFSISGDDENVVLVNNLTLPVPAGPPYSSAEFDVRSGVASTVMLDYVKYNIGPSARTDRRLVTMGADYTYGVTINEQTRFETLIDLLKRCAAAGGGLGFRVLNNEFQVYMPETMPVIISPEMGNLFSFAYSVEAARANYIYIGGSGTGTSRNIYETNDTTSINRWGRIEKFENRNDISTSDMAGTAMSELIYNNSDKTSFSAVALETEGARVFIDYDLGDKVTVEADGMRITDLVQQIHVKLNGQQDERIEATIGNADKSRSDPIYGQIDANNRLSARVRRLETR